MVCFLVQAPASGGHGVARAILKAAQASSRCPYDIRITTHGRPSQLSSRPTDTAEYAEGAGVGQSEGCRDVVRTESESSGPAEY